MAGAFDVFLSHNSKDKAAVRELKARLMAEGLTVWLDEDELCPGDPWQDGLEEGIRASTSVAVLVGKDGVGPWENEEMQAAVSLAVQDKRRVFAVLLPGAAERPELQLFLANRTWVDLRKGLSDEGIATLCWGITGEKSASRSVGGAGRPPEIAPTRLCHGAEHLFGRDDELARLDRAWDDPAQHVLTIVAWGGVGKTSLVAAWRARKPVVGWPGFERVFDWSFYSQGTREQGGASGDAFVAKALEFFGDAALAQSAASPWDKGARLAKLVAEQRTLLVLDGLEPLQHPPGPLQGQLKDPAVSVLLKSLALQNPGLCLVTTRERVADLAPFRETTAPELGLERLSTKAGIALLETLGVRDTDDEKQRLVEDVFGHALTLDLLGRYLKMAHGGDIRCRDRVALDQADAEVQGGHAFKTMAAYETWLPRAANKARASSPSSACLASLTGRPTTAALPRFVASLPSSA